jgi:hypothetical protein
MVIPMTTPRDGRGAVQHPPMHGVLEQAKGQKTQENDATGHDGKADKSADAKA